MTIFFGDFFLDWELSESDIFMWNVYSGNLYPITAFSEKNGSKTSAVMLYL